MKPLFDHYAIQLERLKHNYYIRLPSRLIFVNSDKGVLHRFAAQSLDPDNKSVDGFYQLLTILRNYKLRFGVAAKLAL